MPMFDRASRYVQYALHSFALTVIVLVILNPNSLFSHRGFSYYGNYRATLLPYLLGLGICAFWLNLAARSLPSKPHASHLIRIGLRYSAILLVGIILTPSYANGYIRNAHLILGSVLFVGQFIVSVLLLRAMELGRSGRNLVAAQAATIITSFLSFKSVGVLNLMMPSQSLKVGLFVALMTLALRRLKLSKVHKT
jgi:hypothetical protein